MATLWLLLSGLFDPLLLTLGVLSVIVVVAVALRMDVIDHEGHPIHLTVRGLTYWPWLLWEIVKANVDVAKVILARDLPIEPTEICVKAGQADELGHTIYANSITLTPGTVSLDVEDGLITVHALTQQAAADLSTGEMDRRVTELVDGRKAISRGLP
ncbi:MAG: Na+/H+ antiporter subunit E [Rhodobacterales bacterium]|nr:Na+/H+ antiporter subunit E [Rhodobacterales bacterium]